MPLYAHSHPSQPEKHWQKLQEHLQGVSRLAGGFADAFQAKAWGEAAGLLHDLGKGNPKFQEYLVNTAGQPRGKPSRIDHSTLGAQVAVDLSPPAGRLLAYVLAGHHGGLPNAKDGDANVTSDLRARLGRKDIYRCMPQDIGLRVEMPTHRPFAMSRERSGFQLAFFVRMLFSCLVDADFLDTEAFMSPDKGAWRGGHASLLELEVRFFAEYGRRFAGQPTNDLNAIRRQVFEQCVAKAELPPGFFSLTVPTGGGKTHSSMAFALRHAARYDKRRIVYVIPYMSIIEQNAAEFRDMLGEDDVLEHHSSFDFGKEDDDAQETGAGQRAKLASENWDAPIIATTAVQFFESLFAARPSRCRKLHNLAQSVIVLDEAQTLPRDLLLPCLEALRELVLNYGCTVVLCTATQPAITVREDFRNGLEGVREIMDNPAGLHDALRRVVVENLGELDDEALAARLEKEPRALCIVNTKKHARRLFERLKATGVDGLHHLSTNMYPAHRSRKIAEIKAALAKGDPCVVCSTSLVEAGVNLDFPVVYRAAAGIDSIAQAAGRCDREGRLTAEAGAPGGRVFVFTPADGKGLPPGHFTITASEGAAVMRNHDDPLSPTAVEHYFRLLFWQTKESLDKHGILDTLKAGVGAGDFPFKAIAQQFKIIEDNQRPVIVAIEEEPKRLVRDLEYADFHGGILRKLQKYTVQVRPREFSTLEAGGAVRLIDERYGVLENPDIYQNDVGLCVEDPGCRAPESLFI